MGTDPSRLAELHSSSRAERLCFVDQDRSVSGDDFERDRPFPVQSVFDAHRSRLRERFRFDEFERQEFLVAVLCDRRIVVLPVDGDVRFFGVHRLPEEDPFDQVFSLTCGIDFGLNLRRELLVGDHFPRTLFVATIGRFVVGVRVPGAPVFLGIVRLIPLRVVRSARRSVLVGVPGETTRKRNPTGTENSYERSTAHTSDTAVLRKCFMEDQTPVCASSGDGDPSDRASLFINAPTSTVLTDDLEAE